MLKISVSGFHVVKNNVEVCMTSGSVDSFLRKTNGIGVRLLKLMSGFHNVEACVEGQCIYF